MPTVKILATEEEVRAWRAAAGGGPRDLGPWLRRVANAAAHWTEGEVAKRGARATAAKAALTPGLVAIHEAETAALRRMDTHIAVGRVKAPRTLEQQAMVEAVVTGPVAFDLGAVAREAAERQRAAGVACAKCGSGCGPRCACACHRRAA